MHSAMASRHSSGRNESWARHTWVLPASVVASAYDRPPTWNRGATFRYTSEGLYPSDVILVRDWVSRAV